MGTAEVPQAFLEGQCLLEGVVQGWRGGDVSMETQGKFVFRGLAVICEDFAFHPTRPREHRRF